MDGKTNPSVPGKLALTAAVGLVSRLDRSASLLDRAGLALACIACAVIVIMVLTEIVSRSLGSSTPFASEYGGFFMAALVFLALAATTRERKHITVEFILLALNPRPRQILVAVSDAAFLSYVLVLAAICTRLAIRSYDGGLRSQGLMSTPLFLPQIAMALGLWLLVVRSVVQFANSLIGSISPDGDRDRESGTT